MKLTRKYTANYINTDSNFEIYNMDETERKDEFYSLYCILINLLQRGCPTKPSSKLSDSLECGTIDRKLHLFSKEIPRWGTVIKGHDLTNHFPARTFFYEIVPEKFKEFPFMQQIMIPEVKISEFISNQNDDFYNQQVDFLISEINLVIEIDGSQHKTKEQQLLDQARDRYLEDNEYSVIRIPSSCLKNNDIELNKYVNEIKRLMQQHHEIFEEYQEDYEMCVNGKLSSDLLKAIAIIRFQITVLQLCINGRLSLEDKEWKFAIKNYEIAGYETVAIEDIFVWLENLCILCGKSFQMPKVNIVQTTQLDSVPLDYIKLEMSILNKRNEMKENTGDRIYVSSCWRQDVDYFRMTTAEPIKYIIDDSGTDVKNEQDDMLNQKRVSLRFLLKNLYGFDDFRPGQERIVINALKRRDTIGVLPTGSGKSLCYQMAVLLQPCISFCVCPIKSLMIDQDQNLKLNGIGHTAYISSDLSSEERDNVQRDFADNRFWWVFMSPERFQSESFRMYMKDMVTKQKIHFGYAVIDEVHCLSEWGHSFRVSYLNLIKTIRKYCSESILLGLTATASFNVLKNILVEFNMSNKDDVISIPSFTRPELNFKVIKCEKSTYEELKNVLDRYIKLFPDLLIANGRDTRCGVIFTPYVNGSYGCYPLSLDLKNDYGEKIECYGGERPKKWPDDQSWDDYKKQVQKEYKENLFALLCATKAFGMGIDKPNVRYTIHYGIPSSLEALYQEAGRAGRDKKKAECVILYSEENELRVPIRKYLSVDSTTSDVRTFAKDKRNWNKGKDVFRQLFLLGNELVDIDDELECLDGIIEEYGSPKKVSYIEVYDSSKLAIYQKYIYHLSLIGVVDDWTVDWRRNVLKVYFSDYTIDKVFEITNNYILNYDSEYNICENELYKAIHVQTVEEAIGVAAKIFLTWYTDNIIYSRRQALLNVMEACDAYTEENAKEFKDKMEAYFRLDDISDMLGAVADQPRVVEEWFKILNIDRIRKNKVADILMNLNRFLESYQTNVGLNYISGFLNMIDDHFDTPNGRNRLLASFDIIKDFSQEDKQYVLRESSKLIAQLEDSRLAEEFSEFFIRNFDYDETDKEIYKELEENYSLQTFLHRMMVYMIKLSGGRTND